MLNWGHLEGKCEHTLSVAGSEARVQKDLVDSLDGEDASETRVHVREKCYDNSPDQSTVIILRGLYERIQQSMVENCTRSLT